MIALTSTQEASCPQAWRTRAAVVTRITTLLLAALLAAAPAASAPIDHDGIHLAGGEIIGFSLRADGSVAIATTASIGPDPVGWRYLLRPNGRMKSTALIPVPPKMARLRALAATEDDRAVYVVGDNGVTGKKGRLTIAAYSGKTLLWQLNHKDLGLPKRYGLFDVAGAEVSPDDGALVVAGTVMRSNQDGDAFLLKVSEQGDLVWSLQIDDGPWDEAQRLALDSIGGIYVASYAGRTEGVGSFPSGEGGTQYRRHEPSGQGVWSIHLPGCAAGQIAPAHDGELTALGANCGVFSQARMQVLIIEAAGALRWSQRVEVSGGIWPSPPAGAPTALVEQRMLGLTFDGKGDGIFIVGGSHYACLAYCDYVADLDEYFVARLDASGQQRSFRAIAGAATPQIWRHKEIQVDGFADTGRRGVVIVGRATSAARELLWAQRTR